MIEVQRAILRIYRDRRTLLSSLSDVSQALGRLNIVFYIVSVVINIFIAMQILGIALTSLLPFTTIIVAISFIFSGSASNMFNCIVFLFANHPYDTGINMLIKATELLSIILTMWLKS